MTVFDVFLKIHIISGIVCLVIGPIIIFLKKERGWHTRFGELYHGSYILVFLSAIVTSVIHWEDSAYLFFIALFSYGLALFGYLARKRRVQNWLPKHIAGMVGSYIGIVTAVLIVNIAKIPIANELPVMIFWFLPSIIGTPLIIWLTRQIMLKN